MQIDKASDFPVPFFDFAIILSHAFSDFKWFMTNFYISLSSLYLRSVLSTRWIDSGKSANVIRFLILLKLIVKKVLAKPAYIYRTKGSLYL